MTAVLKHLSEVRHGPEKVRADIDLMEKTLLLTPCDSLHIWQFCQVPLSDYAHSVAVTKINTSSDCLSFTVFNIHSGSSAYTFI